jgi:hypothetical protein
VGFLGGGRDVYPPERPKSFCRPFWSRLLEWKHDDRARCLASADVPVRGCNLPKRKGFDNVARNHSLGDGIEQGFCSGVDFASVRDVLRKRGTGDNEGPANAQIFDEVDRIRNA